jgi:hypothetical protein
MRLILKATTTNVLKTAGEHPILSSLNSIPLFRLECVPTKHSNSDKLRFVVDSENNIIALVSRNFQLTQPREVIREFIAPFVDDVWKWEIHYGQGNVVCRFIFKDFVDVDELKIRPGFMLFDSVTKQFKLRIVQAPYVSNCGNELILERASFSRKHLGLIKVDLKRFIEKFKEWLFDLRLLKFERDRLEKEKIGKESFEAILRDLNLPEKYTKGIVWKPDYTLWNLWMDLTNKLSKLNAPIQHHLKVAKILKI